MLKYGGFQKLRYKAEYNLNALSFHFLFHVMGIFFFFLVANYV